jgi:hypothetical protein
MDDSEHLNALSLVSRFAVSFSVFFILILLNGYFWTDYFSQKNKIALIQKETRTLLSGTVEDQKISLVENEQKFKNFEKENSVLLGELAGTTAKLALTETELLKLENDIAIFASSTELEMKRNADLSRDADSLKKSALPL